MKKLFERIKKKYLRLRFCKRDCSNCKYAYDDKDRSLCELDVQIYFISVNFIIKQSVCLKRHTLYVYLKYLPYTSLMVSMYTINDG